MITLVTGGTGYLGRRVVRQLAAEGARVRCLVRPASSTGDLEAFVGPDGWRNVEVVRGDLSRPATFAAALRNVDVVFHMAAGMSGGAASVFLNSVVATRYFAAACGEAKVGRFILVSSLGVYAACKKGSTLDETCAIEREPHRRDPYTFAKLVQERACQTIAAKYAMPLVILRPGVIVGPGRGALSTRVGISVGRWTFRIGGRRTLPYTYVDNCAAAICLAGRSPAAIGEAINILDDDLPSVREVLQTYRRHGKGRRTIWCPQWAIGPASGVYEWYHHYSGGQLPGVITRYQTLAFWQPVRYSNRKAKQLLSWSPRVPMADALRQAILPPQQRAG